MDCTLGKLANSILTTIGKVIKSLGGNQPAHVSIFKLETTVYQLQEELCAI